MLTGLEARNRIFTVEEIAQRLIDVFGSRLEPSFRELFRVGTHQRKRLFGISVVIKRLASI